MSKLIEIAADHNFSLPFHSEKAFIATSSGDREFLTIRVTDGYEEDVVATLIKIVSLVRQVPPPYRIACYMRIKQLFPAFNFDYRPTLNQRAPHLVTIAWLAVFVGLMAVITYVLIGAGVVPGDVFPFLSFLAVSSVCVWTGFDTLKEADQDEEATEKLLNQADLEYKKARAPDWYLFNE